MRRIATVTNDLCVIAKSRLDDRVECCEDFVMNWDGCEAVESRSDKMSGAILFVGTRIPVSILFENRKSGASID